MMLIRLCVNNFLGHDAIHLNCLGSRMSATYPYQWLVSILAENFPIVLSVNQPNFGIA